VEGRSRYFQYGQIELGQLSTFLAPVFTFAPCRREKNVAEAHSTSRVVEYCDALC
jgi:hypothetical protein